MRNYFSLQRKFWQPQTHTAWVILETIIVTALVLLICYAANPENPLFIRSIFPWPWIAAILMVLRYGFLTGLLAAAIISGTALITGPADAIIVPDYQTYILSCFGVTFFCGLFSSSLMRRCTNAQELLVYNQDKLDSLSRSYYLMHISHNNLEQSLITQPITVRSVMEKLQKLLIQQQGSLKDNLAYQFLQLVCQNCSVSAAGIYLYKNHNLASEPIAMIGDMGPLNLKDPVLIEAMETKELAYVHGELPANVYLVAVPMPCCGNHQPAMLIIKTMAFKALTRDTLRVLSVFINYFTTVNMTKEFVALTTKYSDCPKNFAEELQKLLQLRQKLGIHSGLAAILINKDLRPYNVMDNLKQQQRTLDSVWLREIGNADVLITLMPLTDAEGINGYFNRIKLYLKANFDFNVDQKTIKTRSLQLFVDSPIAVMEKFITFIETATC